MTATGKVTTMGTTSTTGTSRLTETDLADLAKAREIADLNYRDVQAYTGDEDLGMAYAVAFGRAQWEMRNLLRLVERLGGAR